MTVDARGTTNAFGYDPAGRRIASTNAWGTVLQLVTTNSYDGVGNQISTADALNRTTTYAYDALNRRTNTTFADITTLKTRYDGAGRRVAETDQDGVVTLFGYDGLSRLTVVTNAFGKPEEMSTRYDYDDRETWCIR
jgi:YD repeat-containing protein